MIHVIKSISQLNIAQLLMVYEESNRKNGSEKYRNYSAERQLALAEDDLVDYLRNDFFRQSDAFCGVWVADGLYKSALRIESYLDGVLLHALETAPDARKMGYAYSLVSSVLEYLRQEGYGVVYSHIHKRNSPSIRLHEKCGFRKITDSAVLLDGTVTQNTCTMTLKL